MWIYSEKNLVGYAAGKIVQSSEFRVQSLRLSYKVEKIEDR
jgi:hypothetical protein